MDGPFKLGTSTGETEFSHPAHYDFQTLSNGKERLVVGVPEGDPHIIRSLVGLIEEPFYALYVLHTPRGEGDPGRYQSPSLTRADLEEFLVRFADYFSADARFDLWIHSPSDKETIVWERHNLI